MLTKTFGTPNGFFVDSMGGLKTEFRLNDGDKTRVVPPRSQVSGQATSAPED